MTPSTNPSQPADNKIIGMYPSNPGDNRKLYDLGVLREIGNDEAMFEVISLVLSCMPGEIKHLRDLSFRKNWPAVFEQAHKMKGSFSVLQATTITSLLRNIELDTKKEEDSVRIPGNIQEIIRLYGILQKQLENEY